MEASALVRVENLVIRRGAFALDVPLHGLLCAAGVWLLLAYAGVLGLPPFHWRFSLLAGLAALTGAGLVLCVAVGDRYHGMLAASSLLFYPVALVWVPLLRESQGLAKDELLGLDVAFFAVLVLVGAVLPLVHLRPSPGSEISATRDRS
jgi:hypothetical protein